MIRLALAINFIRNNGPSNVVRNLVDCLDHSRFEVVLITFFKNENDINVVNELKNEGAEVIELNFRSRIECMLKAVGSLDNILQKYKIDVLHSHGFIPDILSARCQSKVKKISTIHCNIFEDYLETYGRIKSSFFIPVHLHFLRKLDYQVCCSGSVYNAMKSKLTHGLFIRNGIGNTVVKKPVSREDVGLKHSDIVYIYVGQIIQRKNVVWLIEQFKKTHRDNEYLLVLGRGSEEEACKNILDSNIKMIGFTENAMAYMAIADVYISASHSEGFSISVLEALDCGLLLLLSDVPSHREVLSLEQELYLGETFGPDEFEKKMESLRQQVKTVDRENIKRSKNRHFSAVKMAREYMKLYLE